MRPEDNGFGCGAAQQAEARCVRDNGVEVPNQPTQAPSKERRYLEQRISGLRHLCEITRASNVRRSEQLADLEKELAEVIEREHAQETILVPFTRETAVRLSNLLRWNVSIPAAIRRSSGGSDRFTATELAQIRATVDDVLKNA